MLPRCLKITHRIVQHEKEEKKLSAHWNSLHIRYLVCESPDHCSVDRIRIILKICGIAGSALICYICGCRFDFIHFEIYSSELASVED